MSLLNILKGYIGFAGHKSKYISALDDTTLSDREKNIIKERYLGLVTMAERGYVSAVVVYLLLTNIVTIAGVLIAAIVSIGAPNTTNCIDGPIFWIVWAMSIILTIANKLLYIFDIHKKYILGRITLEKLYSEGWSFLAGVNHYSDIPADTRPFEIFCHRIENIWLKRVGSGYAKPSAEAQDILAMGRQDVP